MLLSSFAFPAPPCHEDAREWEMGDVAVAADEGLGRFQPVFFPAMELEHVVTLSQLKRVAYDCTEANGIQHNFNRRIGEAGKD